MKSKFLVWALALILVMLAPSFAGAEARFPTDGGTVTDEAGVLSEPMRREIEAFAALAHARAGIKMQVVTVHFLDGLNVQNYANQLFHHWELGEKGFLLLAAVGEDSFATASGEGFKKTASDRNVQLLLGTLGFGRLLREQQYEDAFGRFFAAFGQLLGKQFSEDRDYQRLFTAYQEGAEPTPRPPATPPPPEPAPQAPQPPRPPQRVPSIFSAIVYENNARQKARENEGLSFGGLVVLVILIWLVFGGNKAARRGRRMMGCGCGPLSWIVSLFGISRLLGRRR